MGRLNLLFGIRERDRSFPPPPLSARDLIPVSLYCDTNSFGRVVTAYDSYFQKIPGPALTTVQLYEGTSFGEFIEYVIVIQANIVI